MHNFHFLDEVKKRNPRCFYILILLIGLYGMISLTKIEITPFYIWSMYSMPSSNKDTSYIYVFSYDEKNFKPTFWNHHKRMMLTYSIPYYDQYINNNFHSPYADKAKDLLKILGINHECAVSLFPNEKEVKNYPLWLKKYMSSIVGEPIKNMTVYKILVCYTPEGRVKELKRIVLCRA